VSVGFLGAALFNPIASPDSPGFMPSPIGGAIGGALSSIIQEKAPSGGSAVKDSVKAVSGQKVIFGKSQGPAKVARNVKEQGYAFDAAPDASAKKEVCTLLYCCIIRLLVELQASNVYSYRPTPRLNKIRPSVSRR
jgi:hypothetical protein